MVATLYLFACALATSQSAPVSPSEMPLGPRLTRGQELVFRGNYTEESKSQGVQFNRNYRLEVRAFVLEATNQGYELAVMTSWNGRPAGTALSMANETGSARIDMVHVDPLGRMTTQTPGILTIPLDGPPVVECGAFMEEPNAHSIPDRIWEIAEPGRPPHAWHVTGSDTVNGSRCLMLTGVQQTEDWDRPRADSTAWRRTDTLWLTPRTGYASKVERIIERREPARTEVTQKSVLRYELESALQYPAQLYDDRMREIMQAVSFAETVNGLLPHAGQAGSAAFEAVLQRITDHYDRQPPTPYREAIRYVQRQTEAGKRGEVPPETPATTVAPVTQVLTFGKPAPDFLVMDLATKESVSLHNWLGKPIVMLFYNPDAASAVDVLRFAQQIRETEGDKARVIGLAVSNHADLALKQRDELGVKFPLLSGTGLRLSYKVESTPRLIVLDAAGIMRGAYDGWGPEIPTRVLEDLQHCLPGAH